MQQLLIKKILYSTYFAFASSIRRLFSTSLPSPENPPVVKSPFAVEYLVKSCGFPLDKAIHVSRLIPNLKSPTKPDSILQFLRQIGLGDADIRRAITYDPKILCASLENTIKPRMKEIRELGFSASQIMQLVPLKPLIFRSKHSSLQQSIEYWRSFFGSLEGIVSASKKAQYLLSVNVEKVIKPNISFLEGYCGISPSQMRKMIMRHPSIVTMNPNKLKETAQRAEELGLPRGTGMFIYALQITSGWSQNDVDAKIKNLKNIGFSKEEIDSMIKKLPVLLSNSDERIHSSIEFLTGEAGLNLEYISSHPILISYSLERRLIPRHYFRKFLKSKGICDKLSFYSVMKLNEEGFADRFVRPYKDLIPDVFQAYEDACAGQISLKLPLAENPAIKSSFAVEYLVKSCGLPMDKAVKASKYIPHLKSSAKPDSVLQFLREIGVSDADIKRAVTSDPSILCASLENTIKPRMKEIREIGFSPFQVARLVPLVPVIFRIKYNLLQQAVEFWESVFGSLEGILIALKHSSHLLTVSLEKVVKPNISFLEGQCGVSPNQIRMALMRDSGLFTMNPNKLKEVAQKAEKLGIPQGEGLFIYALRIAVSHSPGNLEAKMNNLQNLGFSKEEIDVMIKKQPMLLTNSDERIRQSVIFLASEAGLDLPYIANHPILITFSIERRIIPRLYVIKSLESKGLHENLSVPYVMTLSEKKFGERFVKPYIDIIPEVIEAYGAALAAKFRSKTSSYKHEERCYSDLVK